MIKPALIQPGDCIGIVASSKVVKPEQTEWLEAFLQERGYKVRKSPTLFEQSGMFAGSDDQRKSQLETFWNDDSIDAIWMARGGYGAGRLGDINWKDANPKWLVGYSDVTLLHQQLQANGVMSIHGPMAIDYTFHGAEQAYASTLKLMETGHTEIKSDAHESQVNGSTEGRFMGGNLSMLYYRLASGKSIIEKGDILCLEEVGEAQYSIDRMLYALKNAGIFDQISGLCVGSITNIESSDPDFGLSMAEMIKQVVNRTDLPIAFDLPFGHIANHQPILLGAEGSLSVSDIGVELSV